jgi:PilZ domain
MSLVAKTPMMPLFRDSRKARRRLINYPAWLLLDSRRQPVECIIEDMSDTGARLAITSSVKALPQGFMLWLDKNGKVQRECKIVWRKAGYVVSASQRDRNSQ